MEITRKQVSNIAHDALKIRPLFAKFTSKGIIVRPEYCDLCGKKARKGEQIDGHHEDYSRLFDVLWVCLSCHRMIHFGSKKLTCDDRQVIIKNRKNIMMRLAEKHLAGDMKRIKGKYYEYNKKPIIKTNIYPPEIVEFKDIKVAICQSCLHVWIMRDKKPLYCPACHRINNWNEENN